MKIKSYSGKLLAQMKCTEGSCEKNMFGTSYISHLLEQFHDYLVHVKYDKPMKNFLCQNFSSRVAVAQ